MTAKPKYRYLILDAMTYSIRGTNDLASIHSDYFRDQGSYVFDTETNEGVGQDGRRYQVEPLGGGAE